MVAMTKVSVVIPAYNVRPYIGDCLASLQCQSLKEFEALIVDDGSDDGTAEVVQPVCQQDSRFKLLHKQNGGLSSARNYGIRHASTDYIALLDADDLYKPDKLITHVALLDAHPEVGVVYSASQAIREDGRPTFLRLSGKPIHPDPLLALLCKNFVGHGSNAVFRRCIFDEAGEFDEGLRSYEDLDFWLRIAALKRWCFYREPRVFSLYRVRSTGLSFNVAQMQRCSEHVMAAAYQRSPEEVGPMLPTARAYQYRYFARLSLAAGDVTGARQFIDLALAENAAIFWRDARSLLTLAAVYSAPITKLMIQRTLGSVKNT